MTEAYPLQWPPAWGRTQYPELSRFSDTTIFRESRDIERQLSLLGASNVIISSNMPRNLDGSISSRRVRLADTGVAVYFKMDGEERCIPSDKYVTVEENLHAVALTIQALRGLERWGTGQIMKAAFRGFTALPASIEMGAGTALAWHEVLGVHQDAPPEVIVGAYRGLVKKYHPDNQETGNATKFEQIQKAFKESGV